MALDFGIFQLFHFTILAALILDFISNFHLVGPCHLLKVCKDCFKMSTSHRTGCWVLPEATGAIEETYTLGKFKNMFLLN